MRSVGRKGPSIGSWCGPGVVQTRSRRVYLAVAVTKCWAPGSSSLPTGQQESLIGNFRR